MTVSHLRFRQNDIATIDMASIDSPMSVIASFLYLLLLLTRELVKLALVLATLPWYDLALLLTSSIAAYAGVDLLLRKLREHRLRLEYYIVRNPARANDAIDEREEREAELPHSNLELIYFKIRNEKNKITLADNRIWIQFLPRGFAVLDENEVNRLPPGTPLGTLQKELDCVPLLHPEKPPTFTNLMWGTRKQPTLLMPHIALYDPSYGNSTTILQGDDLIIPIWVRTPETTGTYRAEIKVKPRDISRDLPTGILTFHVR
jgi:hypothetical protein